MLSKVHGFLLEVKTEEYIINRLEIINTMTPFLGVIFKDVKLQIKF